MADQTDKPKERNAFRKAFTSFFADVIFWGAAKSAWKAITDVLIGEPTKKAVEGKTDFQMHEGDKHTFAEAMSRLSFEHPESANKIRKFMETGLRDLDERQDFLINAAKTGKDVKTTQDFLLSLAGLPSDDERREFLKNISFIGEGERDFFETHAATIDHLIHYLKKETRRTQRRTDVAGHDKYWSNYRRLRSEKRGGFRQAYNKTLDVLFGR